MAGPSLYVLPISGGKVKDLGVAAEYIVSIRDGLITFFTADSKLMIAPLDVAKQTVGTPVAVESGLVNGSEAGLADNGTLLMFAGEARTTMELVDERGNGTPIAGGASSTTMMYPRFSPDGKRVIFRRLYDDRKEEIWWQPYVRSGPAAPLQVGVPTQRIISEGIVSPDGAWLVYCILADATGRDIWYRRLRGDTTSQPFEATPPPTKRCRASPPTGDGARTCRTRVAHRRCSCAPSPAPAAARRSPPAAALSRCGPPTASACSI